MIAVQTCSLLFDFDTNKYEPLDVKFDIEINNKNNIFK